MLSDNHKRKILTTLRISSYILPLIVAHKLFWFCMGVHAMMGYEITYEWGCPFSPYLLVIPALGVFLLLIFLETKLREKRGVEDEE